MLCSVRISILVIFTLIYMFSHAGVTFSSALIEVNDNVKVQFLEVPIGHASWRCREGHIRGHARKVSGFIY